jgi:hypothetical protein
MRFGRFVFELPQTGSEGFWSARASMISRILLDNPLCPPRSERPLRPSAAKPKFRYSSPSWHNSTSEAFGPNNDAFGVEGVSFVKSCCAANPKTHRVQTFHEFHRHRYSPMPVFTKLEPIPPCFVVLLKRERDIGFELRCRSWHAVQPSIATR